MPPVSKLNAQVGEPRVRGERVPQLDGVLLGATSCAPRVSWMRMTASCWPALACRRPTSRGSARSRRRSSAVRAAGMCFVDELPRRRRSAARWRRAAGSTAPRTMIVIWPASTCGKNSWPITGPAPATRRTARPTPSQHQDAVPQGDRQQTRRTGGSTRSRTALDAGRRGAPKTPAARPAAWAAWSPWSWPCARGSIFEHRAGTNVHDRTNDASMANATARVSGLNRKPPMPGIRATGRAR